MSTKLITLFAFLVLSIIAGCATGRSDVQVQYWISPDRTEVLFAFPHQIYYFYNNASRLCYTYKIPGKWRPTSESALLQSEDGRAVVGVLLISAIELKDYEGTDLVTRASHRITEIYEKSAGRLLASVKLEPFHSPRIGTMKWSASWPSERAGVQMEASKIFLEITPGWVAQITVNGTPDDDDMARRLLETLSSTSDPECYWPFIRKYLPSIPVKQ